MGLQWGNSSLSGLTSSKLTDHSPFLRHSALLDPLRVCPLWHEKKASPPTPKLWTWTRKLGLRLVASSVIFCGQTTFWQAGMGLSQIPLGKHLTLGAPMRLLPLMHLKSTTVLRLLSEELASRPWLASISGHCTFEMKLQLKEEF